MKKRKPVAIVLLSLITFGIYYLFWLAETKKGLNERTQQRVPSLLLIFIPFIASFALGIVLIILTPHSSTGSGTINLSQTLCPGSTTSQSPSCASSPSQGHALVFLLIYLVVILLSLPAIFYWYYKFSKAVDAYTNKQISTILCFILMWLLGFIGAAIVQDKFNDIEDGVAPDQPYPSSSVQNTPASAPPPATSSGNIISPISNVEPRPLAITTPGQTDSPNQAPEAAAPSAGITPPTQPTEGGQYTEPNIIRPTNSR